MVFALVMSVYRQTTKKYLYGSQEGSFQCRNLLVTVYSVVCILYVSTTNSQHSNDEFAASFSPLTSSFLYLPDSAFSHHMGIPPFLSLFLCILAAYLVLPLFLYLSVSLLCHLCKP